MNIPSARGQSRRISKVVRSTLMTYQQDNLLEVNFIGQGGAALR
ncbi:MAG: hypothetical protein ACUVSW_18415 [Roseiflexus sp.]